MICAVTRLTILVLDLARFRGGMETVLPREDDGLRVRVSILARVILMQRGVRPSVLGYGRPPGNLGRLVVIVGVVVVVVAGGGRGLVMLVRIAAWPLQGSSGRLRGGGPDSILRIHDI